MTLDSGNIKFMRIFAGVPWRGGVKNDSAVIENVDFQGFGRYVFSILENDAGQHYYIVLFSPLSPFH